ncbi:Uncharacterised protein [uncultured archaeon]|nr:Uncharacterised protein [uncultured archaeon]
MPSDRLKSLLAAQRKANQDYVLSMMTPPESSDDAEALQHKLDEAKRVIVGLVDKASVSYSTGLDDGSVVVEEVKRVYETRIEEYEALVAEYRGIVDAHEARIEALVEELRRRGWQG